jgi:transcriptional regulator of NAD metabolism
MRLVTFMMKDRDCFEGSVDNEHEHTLLGMKATVLIVRDHRNKKNKLRGLQSASELYRLSDRHLSTKFSANFCE